MSDHTLEIPHHLDPDEPRVEWRKLVRQSASFVAVVVVFMVALRFLDQLFDDDRPSPIVFETVFATSIQCVRTSAELGPAGSLPTVVPEEGAVSLGRCEDLGFASSSDPVAHSDGRSYIDTYRTEYHVRVAQLELQEGKSEYGPDDSVEVIRVVDEACYEHYAASAPYAVTWAGCPAAAPSSP